MINYSLGSCNSNVVCCIIFGVVFLCTCVCECDSTEVYTVACACGCAFDLTCFLICYCICIVTVFLNFKSVGSNNETCRRCKGFYGIY